MQYQPPRPVHEDMRFHERRWFVRRAGLCLLAIFILLALSGLLAKGVLSAAKAEREGVSLAAYYERFQRRNVQTQFAIQFPKQTEDEIWLRLGRAFQDTYDIEAILPPPARSTSGHNGINLFFDAYDREHMEIVIRARPRRFGAASVEIARLPGALQFPVFIYP